MFPYQNSLYPTMMQPVAQVQPMQLPHQEAIKVNGRAGAEAYQLAPNSSVLMLDNTAPVVWLAVSDGAGYKTLTAYDITVHEEKKPEDIYKKLEDRITKLEERINGHGKSNNSTDAAKQRQ